MRISSDRSFGFDAGPADVWERIIAVEEYRTWWPWLRRFDARALEAGDVWHCTVQPPLPYSLSFTISIEELTPLERVTAWIDGEIRGTAELTLSPTPAGGCTARMQSRLSPANRVLQTIALVARPVVSLGHDWVLDTGARQFRRQVH